LHQATRLVETRLDAGEHAAHRLVEGLDCEAELIDLVSPGGCDQGIEQDPA
jgi:hypothetical protein